MARQVELLATSFETSRSEWRESERALRDELRQARERAESLEAQLKQQTANAAFYQSECEAIERVSLDRERRLTAELFEAQQAAAEALQRAEALARPVPAPPSVSLPKIVELEQRARVAEEQRDRLAERLSAAVAREAEAARAVGSLTSELKSSSKIREREAAANERALNELKERCAALERSCDDYRDRAEKAAHERSRLAECYEAACQQVDRIGNTVAAAEHETKKLLEAKDAEIAGLTARCAEIEVRVAAEIKQAIAAASAAAQEARKRVAPAPAPSGDANRTFSERLRRRLLPR